MADLKERREIPEVLLLIPSQYLPFVIDEVSNIVQLILPGLSILVSFHYRPGDYAYLKLFGQLLVPAQIIAPLLAEGGEPRIFGHPVCQMVFGQDGEMSVFRCGGSDEVGGSGEVVGGVEGLWGLYQLVGV